MSVDLSFYKGKKVFITGHTGFKGSWLCRILVNSGAIVTGYSLEPPTEPNLFEMADLKESICDIRGDVRDLDHLLASFNDSCPEIVFHLAAQPIVREGYKDPVGTYFTNVMGTVNLLDCVRKTPSIKSVVNVTTDKVYQNNGLISCFKEDDPLDGYDPYANSKSCSELVTKSYIRSFFNSQDSPAVSTVRAGNVIGGGDFSKDRIIPDCQRAVNEEKKIVVRNPDSIRPFQHVLEPLAVYLMIAEKQFFDHNYAGNYNVGPDETDCITTAKLVELFCKTWGDGASWEYIAEENAPHEDRFLRLDCNKLKSKFNWEPRWDVKKAIEMICDFNRTLQNKKDITAEMDREIKLYFGEEII